MPIRHVVGLFIDPKAEWRRVDEGLLDAAGMRIVTGRGFEPDDFVGVPRAVVVNQAFADKHWPGGDALDRVSRGYSTQRPASSRPHLRCHTIEETTYCCTQ